MWPQVWPEAPRCLRQCLLHTMIPDLIMLVAESSGLFVLWEENIFRRFYHHLVANTKVICRAPGKDMIDKITVDLTEDEVAQLYESGLGNNTSHALVRGLNARAGGQVSGRAGRYNSHMSVEMKQLVESVADKLQPRVSEMSGQEMVLSRGHFRSCLLVYEGGEDRFGWHLDTEPAYCRRTITLVSQEGEQPAFQYATTDTNASDGKGGSGGSGGSGGQLSFSLPLSFPGACSSPCSTA